MAAIRGWWCALLLTTTIGCGGDEFESGSGSGGTSSGGTSSGGTSSGGTSSGGTSSGGTGGSGATGGASTGGVAGNSTGGTGGVAGDGGDGGSAGSAIPGCGLKVGAPILLYTTLDDASAIQTPAAGIPPGTSGGELGQAKCSHGLEIASAGDFLSYSGAGNINLITGTADFYFKPNVPVNQQDRHLISVAGKFLILWDQQGDLVVGIGGAVAATVPALSVPFVANQWTRVTITWKFQAVGDTVAVYFDGVGAGVQNNPGPFTVPAIGETPLFVGATSESDPQTAVGVFDDVKIYDGTEDP